MSSRKTWVTPTVERIGRIGDVAFTNPVARSQTNGGKTCTTGSPACQRS